MITDTLTNQGENWEDHAGNGRLQDSYNRVDGIGEPKKNTIGGRI
jgi:hypothetical protein